MTISYSKKVIRKDLILGSIFLIVGTYLVIGEPDNILRYGFLPLGLLHLFSGLYSLRNYYIKSENGILRRSGMFSTRSVALANVIKIKSFAGDHTFYTPEKKLKISSEYISKESKPEFEDFLESLRNRIPEPIA